MKNYILVFLISCFSITACQSQSIEKPNIILVVVDDLGYADLSFLPQAPVDVKEMGTPAIDKLAETGIYFDNAYATAPICSPSRAGLITGKYQQRWGNYWYNEGGLPADQLTIPQALKELGYATYKIGKTHLNGGPVEYPTDHGFDEFLGFLHHTWDYIRLSEKDVEAYKAKGVKYFGSQVIGPLIKGASKEKISYENGFTTEIFTDEAIEYIRRDKNNQPFYIQLEYNAVHQPTYVVPEKYAKKFGIPFTPFDREEEKWEYPYWEPTNETNSEFHKRWGHMGEVAPYGRMAYLAQLKALDDNIGRLYQTLKQEKKLDNTILIFMSDNGGTINTYSNNAPLNGYKYMFGEGGIRIPIIISYPENLPSDIVKSQMVSAMDIFPTIMELAGAETPQNIDGISLLNIMKNERFTPHQSLYWSMGRDSTWVVRQGNWKLINSLGWNHNNYVIENGLCVKTEEYTYDNGLQLFNLKEDIGETTNLAEINPEIVSKLIAEYKIWRSKMSDPRTSNGELKKKKKK